MKTKLILLISILQLISCTKEINVSEFAKKQQNLKISTEKSIDFYKKTLLKTNNDVFKNYLEKFAYRDGCNVKNIEQLKSEFQGIKIIKSIYPSKKYDTIFVTSLNTCDADSYYFFNNKIPALNTDSYCAHPENLFTINDIDENGINEIGIFYSSCSSRYKSIIVYRLKNNEWQEIERSLFDVLAQDPTKVQFENLVYKIKKNTFKMLNYEDNKSYWTTINIK